MLKFIVGKTYQGTPEVFKASGVTCPNNLQFVCHNVDSGGDAWSRDVAYNHVLDQEHGWCVATLSELNSGAVTLVTGE